MKKILIQVTLLAFCFTVITAEAKRKKKPRYKPYYMVSAEFSDYQSAVAGTREKIASSPLRILGEYAVTEDRTIFVVTSDKLLAIAGETEFGGYGAVIRVAVTQSESGIQLSYVNPIYMSYAYQMKDASEVDVELKNLFGDSKAFGSKKGISKRSLNGYQYMMMMPEFEDHDKLGSFDSHSGAVAAVNANLASGEHKLTKVFEIAIPGKDEVLIGVGIDDGEGADKFILNTIDVADKKHSAYLPYAVLVSGSKIYSQAGKFRIALAFPDLGMGQFMDISDAPDGILDSLKQLAK